MPGPISPPFIASIEVSQLEYPLYDHFANPAIGYFTLGPTIIWDAGKLDTNSNPVVYPAALIQSSTFSIKLTAEAIALFSLMTPPFTLSAKLREFDIFLPVAIVPTQPISGLSITLQLKGLAKALPWTLNGELEWTLSGSNPEQPKYNQSTSIEVYVLPAGLPGYFGVSGIPLALLRMKNYFPAWMEEVGTGTWQSFVVKATFSDSRLEYESFGGVTRYTSWDFDRVDLLFKSNQGINCWLDLWLSDLHQVKLNGAKHPMNCYDLAALCQVIVTLGISPSVATVYMCYMNPVGFIKPTHLIGRFQTPPKSTNPDSLCNNPFYGDDTEYDPEMYCADTSPKRSSFGNHMFLTIGTMTLNHVLDACCGPETGTKSVRDYITDTIDTAATLYNAPDRAGTELDVTFGIGVWNTIKSRCFERIGQPVAPALTILDKLAVKMSGDGIWSQPYLATPTDNYRMTGTWTFQPVANQNEIVTFSIICYSDEQRVEKEFKRRIGNVYGWSQTIGEQLDMYLNLGNGSTRVWADKNRLYLATIETRIGKSATTKMYKDRIKEVLAQSLLPPNTSSFVKDLIAPKKSPVVGETFDAYLLLLNHASNYYRGYNVRVSPNLFFLTSRDMGSSITFTFLARSTGKATIIITLYGGNLDMDWREVEVDIK